jgi:hypothetical protein
MQGDYMRRESAVRLAYVLVLSAGLLLAAASAAFANTESGYVTWTAGPPNDLSAATPHRDYQTTTQKCAVCHAVHKAPADGELLLRGAAGDSCVYCHVTSTTGVVQIYDGDVGLYNTDNKMNHSRDGGAPCNGCHAVHGANAYGGAVAALILKRLPIQPSFLQYFSTESSENVLYEATGDFEGSMHPAPPNDWENWDEVRGVQVTAFCTGCHPYYTRASEDEVTTDRMIVNGAISTEATSFSTHPMRRAWESIDASGNNVFNFQAAGSTLPDGTRVAYMSTHGCYHCHGENKYTDQGAGSFESSFPHFTANRERFLVSGDGVDETNLDTPDSRQDGTCFVCHVWYGTDGTGITY